MSRRDRLPKAPETPNQWRPITEAPKEVAVLIYEPGAQWVTIGYQENGCWSDERNEDEPIFPTHFMFLPEPPNTGE